METYPKSVTGGAIKPIGAIVDLLNCGAIKGNVLHYGTRYQKNVDYLSTVKPNTVTTGFDPARISNLPLDRYDTVISCYDLNDCRVPYDAEGIIRNLSRRTLLGGNVIIIAQSVSVLNAAVKRLRGWYEIDNNTWCNPTTKEYRRGYDTNEIESMVKKLGLEIVTGDYDLHSTPYNFVVGQKHSQQGNIFNHPQTAV